MSSPADSILDAALKLSEKDRARVAAELVASLDGEPEDGVEAAWASEVEKRIALVDRGEARLLDWEQVRDEVKVGLKRR